MFQKELLVFTNYTLILMFILMEAAILSASMADVKAIYIFIYYEQIYSSGKVTDIAYRYFIL